MTTTPITDNGQPDSTLNSIMNIEAGAGTVNDWLVIANAGLIPHLQGSYGRQFHALYQSGMIERDATTRQYTSDCPEQPA